MTPEHATDTLVRMARGSKATMGIMVMLYTLGKDQWRREKRAARLTANRRKKQRRARTGRRS